MSERLTSGDVAWSLTYQYVYGIATDRGGAVGGRDGSVMDVWVRLPRIASYLGLACCLPAIRGLAVSPVCMDDPNSVFSAAGRPL